MKCWNLVGVLALSSLLLPVFAQETVNSVDKKGFLCEQTNGMCVDDKNTANCMAPLEELDCSDGEKCCKERSLPKDSAAISLLRKGKPCKQDSTCTDHVGGQCIKRRGHCEGQTNDTLCSSKKCTCCIEGPTLGERIDNLESALISRIESSCMGSGALSTILDQLSLLPNQLYCTMKNFTYFYGGSCYFFSSEKTTWLVAQEICVEMGGNLVTINNDDEFNFLRDHLIGEPWVGINDIDTEGQFIWISDGSPFPSDSPWWHDGEPNDSSGNEDCGHFWVAKMLNDRSCNSRPEEYICEMTP